MKKNIISSFLALSLISSTLFGNSISPLRFRKEQFISNSLLKRIIENPPMRFKTQLLSVPQFVQENSYFCVPACLQMVLAFHGIQQSQATLAFQMNTSPITGTEYVDLAYVVNQYLFNCEVPTDQQVGYRVQRFSPLATMMSQEEKDLFRQRIFLDISTQDPIFVAVNRNILYPELSAANHMVIIVGYALFEATNQLAYYYLIDPSYQVQDHLYGGLKVITEDELIKGIMLNEEKEKAYIW